MIITTATNSTCHDVRREERCHQRRASAARSSHLSGHSRLVEGQTSVRRRYFAQSNSPPQNKVVVAAGAVVGIVVTFDTALVVAVVVGRIAKD